MIECKEQFLEKKKQKLNKHFVVNGFDKTKLKLKLVQFPLNATCILYTSPCKPVCHFLYFTKYILKVWWSSKLVIFCINLHWKQTLFFPLTLLNIFKILKSSTEISHVCIHFCALCIQTLPKECTFLCGTATGLLLGIAVDLKPGLCTKEILTQLLTTSG